MTDSEVPLAQGGGNATAAGVAFQASIASYFGALLLSERPIDRLPELGQAFPVSVRVETEAPMDDVLIETTTGGLIFVQAKTSLTFENKPNSPLGKTIDQIVRQWMVCSSGTGSRKWDRPLSPAKDRFVLAIGPETSGTIRYDLAAALRAARAPGHAPLPKSQQAAFDRFVGLLRRAWRAVSGNEPSSVEVAGVTALVEIITFDFAGADSALVTSEIREIVESVNDAAAAFSALQSIFTRLMAQRLGVDASGLRSRIAASVRLKEPPSYRADVAELHRYSDATRAHLEHFEETRIGGQSIRIDRKCTASVLKAVKKESFLIVGDPGAGKSAVISAAASCLRTEGKEVIELAVDRLPVESADGLQQQLGLSHRVLEVLENWPGNEPAFLFIDALDATRGGRSERIFRWLISEILSMPRRRWRVVASIRSFDLRMGQQFRELFAGEPPDERFSLSTFGGVKHVHIPVWDEEELKDLLARAQPLAQAVVAGGDKLFQLARTPFNTRLLADLLSEGVQPNAFSQVSTQSQLLDMYWERRVQKHGIAAELVLKRVVAAMVERRSLQTDRLSAGANDPAALESLLRENVLVTVSGERYVAFRHHILFDFAASRVYLDLRNAPQLADKRRCSREHE